MHSKQSMVVAPLVQSLDAKIYKLWGNHPVKTDYTAPPYQGLCPTLTLVHTLKTAQNVVKREDLYA